MTGHTGLSPQNPNKYLGPNVYQPVVVTRNREPTTADYRQPETGKLYTFCTFWLIGKNPTSGTYGDIWVLNNIISNQGMWSRISGTEVPGTITGDDGIPLIPILDNWNIIGQKNGIIPVIDTIGDASTATLRIEDRTSTTAFVVDPSSTAGQRGTFSTIQAAINAASSGQTIFIKDGTYIENPILKPGVNIFSYTGSGTTINVTIKGKCTFSSSGIVTISGVRLETNSDLAVNLTGSGDCILYLIDCFLNMNGATLIGSTNTSSASRLRIINSIINTASNDVVFNFDTTSAASLSLFGVSTLESMSTSQDAVFKSTGLLSIRNCTIRFPITLVNAASGSPRITAECTEFNTSIGDRTCVLITSDPPASNENLFKTCTFLSGSSTAFLATNISVVYLSNCDFYSTGVPVIFISTTATLFYSSLTFMLNPPGWLLPPLGVGLPTRKTLDPGLLYGNFSGSTVSPGYVGEYIVSKVAFNAGVALTTDVTATVTTIDLTPGTWDVTGIVMFTGITTGTYQNGSISTSASAITSASYGDNTTSASFTTTVSPADDVGVTIPVWRVSVTPTDMTKTIYLKARAGFSVGTASAYGRVSATRVC
jgi:hypothetical protein